MREMVLAIRAIWESWQKGTRLDFRGDFYQHTLMTPFFDPGPNPHGPAKIFLAGVGQLMTEVAGELCDGLRLGDVGWQPVHPCARRRMHPDATDNERHAHR